MGKRVAGGVTMVAGLLLAATVGASAATGPSTIRITDVQIGAHVVDLGPDGPGRGDVGTVSVRLYNPSITPRPIGRGDMLCSYIDQRRRTCNGTYSLPRGKLVVTL